MNMLSGMTNRYLRKQAASKASLQRAASAGEKMFAEAN